jgi:Domain of unknown function (DUF4258)
MTMTATEMKALADIRGYAGANRVRYSRPHAFDRMNQRGATTADVEHALRTATECHLQPNGRYEVTSRDLDGDEIIVIVVLQDEDFVVTIF